MSGESTFDVDHVYQVVHTENFLTPTEQQSNQLYNLLSRFWNTTIGSLYITTN